MVVHLACVSNVYWHIFLPSKEYFERYLKKQQHIVVISSDIKKTGCREILANTLIQVKDNCPSNKSFIIYICWLWEKTTCCDCHKILFFYHFNLSTNFPLTKLPENIVLLLWHCSRFIEYHVIAKYEDGEISYLV